jgi:hypothetical protein
MTGAPTRLSSGPAAEPGPFGVQADLESLDLAEPAVRACSISITSSALWAARLMRSLTQTPRDGRGETGEEQDHDAAPQRRAAHRTENAGKHIDYE